MTGEVKTNEQEEAGEEMRKRGNSIRKEVNVEENDMRRKKENER